MTRSASEVIAQALASVTEAAGAEVMAEAREIALVLAEAGAAARAVAIACEEERARASALDLLRAAARVALIEGH